MNRRNYDGENNPNWRGGNVKNCENCGNEFIDVHYDGRRFCSKSCARKFNTRNSGVLVTCKVCGGEFKIKQSKADGRKYCSAECMGKDTERTNAIQTKRKGWVMSEDARQKISESASRRSELHSSGKQGHYVSAKAGTVHYRSSYELKAYKKLDAMSDVDTYQVEPFSVEYLTLDGKVRRYRPDILVTFADKRQQLIEVKAAWQLDETDFLVKTTQAVIWAKQKGIDFQIWTEATLGLV